MAVLPSFSALCPPLWWRAFGSRQRQHGLLRLSLRALERETDMSIRLTFLCALLVTLPIAVSSGGIPRVPLGHDEIRYLNSIPKDNPLTRTKIALGKLLFFDKRLSRDGSIACGSCHQLHRAFTDGRVLPTGIDGQTPKRNAPTLINRAYGTAYFYDGRAASLEEQALIPIQSPSEMGNTLEHVVATLSVISGYHAHFKAAFGDSTITPDRTDAEKQDLIAFLKALNGINWLHIEPPFRFPK